MTPEDSDRRKHSDEISSGQIDMRHSVGSQIGDHNTQQNDVTLLRIDQVDQLTIVAPQEQDSAQVVNQAAALATTVDRHHRRNNLTRPPVMASHPGVGLLVDRLCAQDGHDVVVVHGRAGSGKSTVIADAVQRLIERGWTAAVIRMDTVADICRSADALGRASDLHSSPVQALDVAVEGEHAVLIIDQLDAVSTYSGRIPDNYEAVAELIEQAEAYKTVKVVLAVRSADLTADPRMRWLLAREEQVESLEIGELGAMAVSEALTNAGIDVSKLSSVTLDLLRVPLHLAVFIRLSPESHGLPYRTLPDLYSQFTDEVAPKLEHHLGATGWYGAIAPLVNYMSDHESLQAPVGVLDGLPDRARPALVSAGLLVEEGVNVAFFHETFFDYLFARAFVAQGQELHSFLEAKGQQLFRRAQTRQVLEYLISADRRRFRTEITRLLGSSVIRSHLLDVAISVLNSLPASGEDWLALEPLAFGKSKRSTRLVGLLSSSNWFDAADSAGRWEPLLLQPSTATASANVLIMAARDRPARVAELVKPYISTSEEWNLRLRAMIQWSLTPGLVDLTIDLMQRGLLDDVRGPIAANSDFWSLVYGLKEDDSIAAAKVIGAYLDRALTRARSDGIKDPFLGYIDNSAGAGGGSLITDLAAAAPEQFLENVLPFVMAVLRDTATERPGRFMGGPPWRVIFFQSHQVHGAIIDGLDRAIQHSAPQLWSSGSHLILDLAASKFEVARFLACRAYSAIAKQAADSAIEWLISDDRNLNLGWQGSRSWATRQLIENSSPYCQDDNFSALCSKLLNYYPPSELTVDALRVRGYRQYELLSALPADRLTPTVRRRLGELERKFPNEVFLPPVAEEAQFVGSPVPEKAGEHMTDEDWRRAIVKYDSNIFSRRRDFATGGATELAGMLGRRAAIEPQRFVELALTFDKNTPPAHIIEIINSVRAKIPVELLTDLCTHARLIAGAFVGRTICSAVASVAEAATDSLIDLLEHYAQADDPQHELISEEPQSHHSGERDLSAEGLDSTRGLAAEAIGRVLFAQPHLVDRLYPTVELLANDSILSVRAQATKAILAIFNTRLVDALNMADVLFRSSSVDIYYSDASTRLLRCAIYRDQERFGLHLDGALRAVDPIATRAGHIWANALLNKKLPSACPATIDDLRPAARRGVAMTMATAPHLSTEYLPTLFNDESVHVRDAAAASIRQLDEVSTAISEEVVQAFAGSIAFADNFEELFRSLVRSLRLLPSTAITACEQALKYAGNDLGDIRTASAAASRDIVTIVLRLYRQGDPSMRTRCLDVVDRLSDVEAYGLSEALQHER